MRTNRSIPSATIIPELAYADVPSAAAWLCRAFGFREHLRIGDHRVQLLCGDGAIVVMDRSREASDGSPSGHGILVRVENVDAHYARAVAAGADVSSPPVTHPYASANTALAIRADIAGRFRSRSATSTPRRGAGSWCGATTPDRLQL